jgi:hypothetical protein
MSKRGGVEAEDAGADTADTEGRAAFVAQTGADAKDPGRG